MSKSAPKPARPVNPATTSRPEYPDLREHKFTRRNVLTFVGASLITGTLSACLKGKPADPNFRSFRLPAAGELETTLASGETCRFYVNGTYYGELVEDLTAAETACMQTLGEHTASDLATSDGRWDAEQDLDSALYSLFPNFDSVYLTIVAP